jgi:hypothetical protein
MTDSKTNEVVEAMVEAAMRDSWDDICSDTGCHPLDIRREGRKLFFEPNHWVRGIAMRLTAAKPIAQARAQAVEDAAKVADGYSPGIGGCGMWTTAASRIAERIRALAQSEGEGKA